MINKFLPYAKQEVDEDDVSAVVKVLRSNWLTTGPLVNEFEETFANYVGARHAVVCSSGTAGLHISNIALNLGPDDAVIIPSITFLATANAVRFVGAEVIFADVDAKTGLMEEKHLEHAINTADRGNLRAVFPVHLSGQCADLTALAKISRTHDLRIIEDAAHALGTKNIEGEYHPNVGSCTNSDLTVFSFHPVKTATMGEGGLVTTNNEALANRLNLARNHGMSRNPKDFRNYDLAFDNEGNVNPWYYEMCELGYNYRASDIQCALGLSQLRKLNYFVEQRAKLVAQYDERLKNLSPMLEIAGRSKTSSPGWHLYSILIDFNALGKNRATIMQELKTLGIGTQVHYLPVCHQPYYRNRYGVQLMPGADAYYERQLSLPLFSAMNSNDVDRVATALLDVLK